MTDALALIPSPDVAVLASLPENEIDEAVGLAWQSFGRRTVVDAWHLGVQLRRVKEGQGRHFAAYCERIVMSRSWAYDLLTMAGGPLSEVSGQRTIAGAVKVLKALKAAPEPAPEPAPVTPAPAPEVGDDLLPGTGPDTNPASMPAFNPRAAFGPAEPAADAPPAEPETEPAAVSGELLIGEEAEDMMQEAVDEAGPLPDGRIETTEGERRATKLYREMRTGRNSVVRQLQAARRGKREIGEDIAVVPRSDDAAVLNAAIDDIYAKHFNKARKAA